MIPMQSSNSQIRRRVGHGQRLPFALLAVLLISGVASAQKAKQVFEDGEAQVVDAFNEPKDWVQHDLWVETSFDTDGDGKKDRMHVAVTRPEQTETEG